MERLVAMAFLREEGGGRRPRPAPPGWSGGVASSLPNSSLGLREEGG